MDKQYWDLFYKKNKDNSVLINASSFAKFCQEKFLRYTKKRILELGSGSGRDANFFANNLHTVVAIDQSHEGLVFLQNSNKNSIQYLKRDFVTMNYNEFDNIDVVYSRFTLHAIQENECETVIQKIANYLKKDGLFMIEARSTKDPLCGEGKMIAKNTWFTDHTRRFIDSHEFIQKNFNNGFKLLYFTEENNLSIYKEDNPVLIRAIFKKL
jgi:cyclopropane fatty-acyl-phospholipid synthase-like methyltransferase